MTQFFIYLGNMDLIFFKTMWTFLGKWWSCNSNENGQIRIKGPDIFSQHQMCEDKGGNGQFKQLQQSVWTTWYTPD